MVKQLYRKVNQLVVDTTSSGKSFIILLLAVFVLNSCEHGSVSLLYPNNNHGGYTLEKQPIQDNLQTDSVRVFGFVYDVDDKNPLMASAISFYCYSAITNEYGYYELKIEKSLDVDTYLSAVSIGYKKVETSVFDIKGLNSIKVNIYLQKDQTPIYHCDQ